MAGEGVVDTHRLRPGTLAIGRGEDTDIRIDHGKISRRHALLHVGETFELEDLDSTNGTRLAGRKLVPGSRAVVNAGECLQLGPFIAVVLAVAEQQPAADEPLRAAIPVVEPTEVSPLVSRIAGGMVSVLITGETGVGKEVLARTMHRLSGRSGELVAINCASLSESLLESELFGHERGAFSGAASLKRGLFEVAAGGTVFLDEIGDLPSALQARLLRVLESRTAYRVGGLKPVSLDVRFVSATHRDLAAEVERGTFRRDLYFRINGITLNVTPLRTRREAIPTLARELLARIVAPQRKVPRLTPSALDVMMRHDWPGNVRELRAVMERAMVLCDGDVISANHIMVGDPAAPAPRTARPAEAVAPAPPPRQAAPEPDSDERERIVAVLAECAGNQTRAAHKLGVSRTTLVHKLAIHRIPRPRKRRG